MKVSNYYFWWDEELKLGSPVLLLGLWTVPHAWLRGIWTVRDDSGRSHGHLMLLFPITMEEAGVYGEIYGTAEEVASSTAVCSCPALCSVSSAVISWWETTYSEVRVEKVPQNGVLRNVIASCSCSADTIKRGGFSSCSYNYEKVPPVRNQRGDLPAWWINSTKSSPAWHLGLFPQNLIQSHRGYFNKFS